jgi:hypothetical protein
VGSDVGVADEGHQDGGIVDSSMTDDVADAGDEVDAVTLPNTSDEVDSGDDYEEDLLFDLGTSDTSSENGHSNYDTRCQRWQGKIVCRNGKSL